METKISEVTISFKVSELTTLMNICQVAINNNGIDQKTKDMAEAIQHSINHVLGN